MFAYIKRRETKRRRPRIKSPGLFDKVMRRRRASDISGACIESKSHLQSHSTETSDGYDETSSEEDEEFSDESDENDELK